MIKERFNKIEIPISYFNYGRNRVMWRKIFQDRSEWSLEMAFLRLEAIFRTCLNAEDYFLRIGKNFSPR
ncbi:hypothetical protein T12_13169 [Trichinella patagoniensis]|uniref:Uncharacterized protein n=1 Tax=Trichinella patagoniensis TaxID=990121 RepID=A0A0V1A9G8_9BILA|nr:hypothetical protein T12_13169 [Trichinella patagoniensis]